MTAVTSLSLIHLSIRPVVTWPAQKHRGRSSTIVEGLLLSEVFRASGVPEWRLSHHKPSSAWYSLTFNSSGLWCYESLSFRPSCLQIPTSISEGLRNRGVASVKKHRPVHCRRTKDTGSHWGPWYDGAWADLPFGDKIWWPGRHLLQLFQ